MIFKLVCNIINAKVAIFWQITKYCYFFCSFLGVNFNYSSQTSLYHPFSGGFGGISLPDNFKHWRKTNILQGITIRKSSIIYSLQHWREMRSVGWSERWFIKWVVKLWGWSRLQKTIWSQIAPWPENIPPKGVSFSDLICIFAMSYQSFCLFSFRNTKISENSDIAKSGVTFCCSGA